MAGPARRAGGPGRPCGTDGTGRFGERGAAVVLATHDADEVLVIMERGKIVEQGTVDEIFANPTEEYTKRLLDAIPGASIPLGGGAAAGL